MGPLREKVGAITDLFMALCEFQGRKGFKRGGDRVRFGRPRGTAIDKGLAGSLGLWGRMGGVMGQVLEVWEHQRWKSRVERSFTQWPDPQGSCSCPQTCSLVCIAQPLTPRMASSTELVPVLLTREDKVQQNLAPACVSSFIYLARSSNSSHTRLHCIL